jgi:hypothetical protein
MTRDRGKERLLVERVEANRAQRNAGASRRRPTSATVAVRPMTQPTPNAALR